ncbi:exocyst complex component 3-like protein 4 [Coturnix japonica]|uniref:Exocyst complex component 3 like 4 n=1 Tax=Coturnix japonica TaxID=93934 RepID=A0A8C2SR54_COTJA|nr:exocyst complex component 3-like protein 4 [Coturnix japonica]
MSTDTKVHLRRSASEPDPSTNDAEKEKMEVASELGSPTLNDENTGFIERGIKTMLSIRRSKRKNEKEQEGTGTWRRRLLSFQFPKSSDENRTEILDGLEEIVDKTETDPTEGKPLSVMEINELIQRKQLLEAFASIKYMEDEMIAERDADKYKDNPQEFLRKTKDVDLLYSSITSMIRSIVVGTLENHTVEESTLTSLVTLIAREEAAHPNTGSAPDPGSDLLGAPRKWREVWREAVKEGTRKRVLGIPLASKEEEKAWLDLHLNFLQKCLLTDLLKIKSSVKKCYPEEYRVCEVYVEAFHNAIASHLQDLSQRPLEFNELYSLLDWVANTYHSELCLGHSDLKPEVQTGNLSLLLTTADWDRLNDDYISSVKGKIKSYFGKILTLEVTEKWEKEDPPEVKDNLYQSSVSFDIQTIIGEHMKLSEAISKKLKRKTLELCLAELHEFIPRFRKEFLEWNTVHDSPMFAPYFAAYINSFHDLLSGLETVFKVNTEELQKILAAVTENFRNVFLDKLRTKTQPLLKKILTKDWILAIEKPDSLAVAVSQFSEHLQHTRQPLGKELLCHVHKYVVREYIVQIIRPKKKMNGEKRLQVRERINQEAKILNNALIDHGSDSSWLLPAISHIANIIGEKRKDRIKEYVKELTQDYPDIRKEHIMAILAVRGLGFTSRRMILQQGFHHALESPDSEDGNTLFAEIDVPAIISCF